MDQVLRRGAKEAIVKPEAVSSATTLAYRCSSSVDVARGVHRNARHVPVLDVQELHQTLTDLNVYLLGAGWHSHQD